MRIRTQLLPILLLITTALPAIANAQFGASRRPIFQARTPRFQATTPRFRGPSDFQSRVPESRRGWAGFKAGWNDARANATTPPWWERSSPTNSGSVSRTGSTSHRPDFRTNPTIELSWQPPFLPISFSIDSNGDLSIEARGSIVTPIGTFSIGTALPLREIRGFTYVVVGCRETGKDHVYRIKKYGDGVTVETEGRTKTRITDRYVFIDVLQGNAKISVGASQ